MQAIADAHVLQVAEPGVESDQRLVRQLALGGAFLDEAALPPAFENERRNGPRAARIEPLRLGELVEQALELQRCSMSAGGDQRRRQMADGRRADAALGLRRLAGIVDDERIDDRRRAKQDLRGAALAERDGLARQPFQRAVRAELNERVDLLLARKPEIERGVGMARRQVEIVIVALAGRRVSAVGLDRDNELAEPHEADPKRAVDQVAIVRRLAPGGEQRLAKVRRGRGELGLVFAERQRRLERSILERGDERGRVEAVGHIIAGGAESLRDGDRARRRIETDRIASAPAARRIVRQHASEAPVRRRFAPKVRPAASKLGGEVDPVGERPVHDRGEFGARVFLARRLEGNGSAEDLPVDLRQRDMHGEIGRSEPPLRRAPGIETNARKHDLQHRGVERIERRPLAHVQPRGKGGQVEHDVEALLREERAEQLERRLVLQTGQEDARDCEALVAESAGQRFDRLEIACEIDRAIEDDKRAWRLRRRLERGAVETAEGRDRIRRRSLHCGAPDFGGEKGEARRHVVRAALVEIPPDAQERGAVEGRGLIEPRIAPPISRQ